MRNANTCVHACFHALTNAHAHAHAHAHARVRTRNKGRSAIVQHHFYPLLATRTCEQARTHANTRTQTHKCMQCTARAHAHKTNTSRGVFPDERRRLGHRRGYTYQNLNIHHVLAHQPADPPSTFQTACQGKGTATAGRGVMYTGECKHGPNSQWTLTLVLSTSHVEGGGAWGRRL